MATKLKKCIFTEKKLISRENFEDHACHFRSRLLENTFEERVIYCAENLTYEYHSRCSEPDGSTNVVLTAAHLEIPAPVIRLVVGIETNVVARLTRDVAATMLSGTRLHKYW